MAKAQTGKAEDGGRDAPRDGDDFDQWSAHYGDFYPSDTRLDLEFRLSRMLVLAGKSWTHRIDNILREETGQSRARWQMLFAIGFAEQPATLSELAKRLRVQWPTLMRVIDGLVADGLVAREDNPADGRSKLVRLTAKGQETLSRIQPILDRERKKILARFSEEELKVCADLLERIFEDVINL
ncbi:MAG: MarR family transcriptional regulator [Oricola sp.]|nr:MarR family transcriptional regulator [Oricola sp.]